MAISSIRIFSSTYRRIERDGWVNGQRWAWCVVSDGERRGIAAGLDVCGSLTISFHVLIAARLARPSGEKPAAAARIRASSCRYSVSRAIAHRIARPSGEKAMTACC